MYIKIREFFSKAWLAIFSLAVLGLPTKAGASISSGLSQVSSPFSFAPISNVSNVNQLIAYIINLILGITGGIAILFLIFGGYMYVTSAGNEEQAEKGRKTVTNAIIGIVIIILSYVIVRVISNLVSGSSI